MIGKLITEKISINNALKQGLTFLLFNIVLDMDIGKENIGKEIFTNYGPKMILAYADDIDTIGDSDTKIKEMFVTIKNEIKKGWPINDDKTKYMHLNRRLRRDRIGHSVTMDRYNFQCVIIIMMMNDISNEIRLRIRKDNRCFFAMHDLFKSKLLSRNSNWNSHVE